MGKKKREGFHWVFTSSDNFNQMRWSCDGSHFKEQCGLWGWILAIDVFSLSQCLHFPVRLIGSSLWFVFMCFLRWLKSDEMYSHWLLGHTRRMRPWLCLWGWLGLAGLASCDVASPCHNSIMWTYLHINKLGYKTVHMRQGEAAKRAPRGNQGYTTALHLDVEVFFTSQWKCNSLELFHWMQWTCNYCIAVTLISSHIAVDVLARKDPAGYQYIFHTDTHASWSIQFSWVCIVKCTQVHCTTNTSAHHNVHNGTVLSEQDRKRYIFRAHTGSTLTHQSMNGLGCCEQVCESETDWEE